MELRAYNNSLTEKYVMPEKVINSIRARQLSAAHKQPEASNELMPDEVFKTAIQIAGEFNIEPGLQEMREKALNKWIAPQGGPGDPHQWVVTLKEYDQLRSCLPLELPPEVKRVLRAILRPMRQLIREKGMIITDLRLTDLIEHKVGNTGYFYFTSDRDRLEEIFPQALELARDMFHDAYSYHPMIGWYRQQRGSQRSIFGGSTPLLILGKGTLRRVLDEGQALIPEYSVCSPIQVSQDIQRYWARHPQALDNEFDLDKMDQHQSYGLDMWALRQIAEALDLTLHELEILERVCGIFHSVPVMDLNAQVHFPTHMWNLLSGIYPTHGMENHTSLIMALLHVYRMARLRNEEYDWLLQHTLIRVCGDDMFIMYPDSKCSDSAVPVYTNIAATLGHANNEFKCRQSTQSVWYCKRGTVNPALAKQYRSNTFTSGLPDPVYPVELALNSIAHPEDGSPQLSKEQKAFNAARTIARFDNAAADPRFPAIIKYWLSAQPYSKSELLRLIHAGSLIFTDKDWFRHVNGVSWNPTHSATIKLIMKSNW